MEALQYLIALLPVAILGFYIYKKDSLVPEPVGQLWDAFSNGALSCVVSLAISIPLLKLGAYTDEPETIWGAVKYAFLGAAIPEECAKLLMLWWMLRKTNYVDEWMDGIVYAVFISLGFAAVENILYIVDEEDWLRIGITRALFSVPGHFGFGILMGYYYSLAKLSLHHVKRNRILLLAAPILAHGTYDAILFSIQVKPIFAILGMLVFLFVCHKLWKYGKKKVQEHLDRDREFFRLMEEQREGR